MQLSAPIPRPITNLGTMRLPPYSNCHATSLLLCCTLRSHPRPITNSWTMGVLHVQLLHCSYGVAPVTTPHVLQFLVAAHYRSLAVVVQAHNTGLAHGMHREGCRLQVYTSMVPAACVVAGGCVAGPCVEDALLSSGC